MTGTPKRHQGINITYSDFTLIELLIVIAIIAILAGMLLPALKAAREKARTTQCVNNIRQIGSAAYMYLNDYQEYFPPSSPLAAMEPSLKDYTGIDPDKYSASKNYFDHKIWACPNDTYRIEKCKSEGFIAGSYAQNFYMRSNPDAASHGYTRLPQIKSPSKKIYSTDAGYYDGLGSARPWIGVKISSNSYPYKKSGADINAGTFFRHQENTPVLWLSGSVSTNHKSSLTGKQEWVNNVNY